MSFPKKTKKNFFIVLMGPPLAIEQASADLSMQGPLSSRALEESLNRAVGCP